MLEVALFGSSDGSGTRWRLVGVDDDVARSHQYVRLKFDVVGGQLRGVLVAWNTDEEVPLVDLRFDGIRLSLRLPVTVGAPQRGAQAGVPGGRRAPAAREKAPRLSLVLDRDREFRGFYVDELNRRLDPDRELRLVKMDDEVAAL